MHRRTVLTASAAAVATAVGSAFAQDAWPSRPINYVVPHPRGRITDNLANLIAPKAAATLGTAVVVDNRPGPDGIPGTEFTAHAAPDGYTIQGGSLTTHVTNLTAHAKLPYDPVKDFQPITLIGSLPFMLVVRADSVYKTVQDVLAAAKAKPGTVRYSSGGIGSPQHLAAALFEQMAGVRLLHDPVTEGSEASLPLLAGQDVLLFEDFSLVQVRMRVGQFRALGIAAAQRLPLIQRVPPIADAVPGYSVQSWQAVFAPAGVPRPIVDRLSAALVRAIQDPENKAQMVSHGFEPVGGTPDELAAFQRSELEKWARVAKAGQIKLE